MAPGPMRPFGSSTSWTSTGAAGVLMKLLSKLGIEVFEAVPPAVDTELNPEGRAGRGGFKTGLTAGEFTTAVMKGLEDDVLEIGYGMTERTIKASRAELDAAFERMNSRW